MGSKQNPNGGAGLKYRAWLGLAATWRTLEPLTTYMTSPASTCQQTTPWGGRPRSHPRSNPWGTGNNHSRTERKNILFSLSKRLPKLAPLLGLFPASKLSGHGASIQGPMIGGPSRESRSALLPGTFLFMQFSCLQLSVYVVCPWAGASPSLIVQHFIHSYSTMDE